MSLPNDNFGRTVTMVTTNGQDVYTITSTYPPYPNAVFTLSFPTGTPQAQVYNTINSYWPAGYTPPAQPAATQGIGNTGVIIDGANNLTANSLISTVTTGTPPLTVTSTTAVPNLTASNVVTNANLTGPITSIGNATSLASQTGTGSNIVVDTSPTLITPLLGTPTSGTLTNCTGLPLTTGITATFSNGGIVYSGSSALSILSGTSTADQVLLSGSSGAPSWSTATYPATTTINQLLYSSAANTISGLATANSAALVTSSTGVPVYSGTMTNGQLIIGSTGATPVAASLTAGSNITITPGAGTITISASNSGGTVTSVTASAPLASSGGNTPNITITGAALTETNDTNVTLTLGGSASSALVNAASITAGWTGQLSLTRGGTNASLTASNGGIFYSTASAGAILSGTATANQLLLSGASGAPAWSTVTHPATTTINQLLYSSAANVLSGLATANSAVLVTSSTGVPVYSSTMTNGQIIVGSTSATPAAVSVSGDISLSSSGATAIVATSNSTLTTLSGLTTASSLASVGTITSGTWNATNIALGHGGTNASLTASNGGIFYSTASAGAILSGTATANQILLSGSSAAPTWSTATYPATTTINQLLYSTATNTLGGSANLTYNGTLSSLAGNASTSVTTGDIVATGGIGIGKNIWLGSAFTATNSSVDGSILNIPAFTYTTSTSNPANVNITTKNQITLNGTGTATNAATLYIAGAPVAGTLAITNPWSLQIAAGNISLGSGTITNSNSTASTSNTTGAITLAGGIGISNTTDATSATNGGTITTAGGAAITKSLWVGTNETLTGTSSILSLTGTSSQISVSGTTASTSNTTGAIVTAGGIASSNTTNATSSTNGGSITTAGGVAIAKDLFVGGIATTTIAPGATTTNLGSSATAGAGVVNVGSSTASNVQTSAMSWTASTPLSTGTFTSVCFGLDLFVAVASNGTTTTQIYTSPDGHTWTARTSPNALAWQSVCYAPDLQMFCAVANNSATTTVMTATSSTVTTTWTAGTSINAAWSSVCRGTSVFGTFGNVFVAVANVTAQACVMTGIGTGAAPQTIAWTSRSIPTATTTSGWRSVCWSDGVGLFCAVSASSVAATGAMTSPDGVTWTMRTVQTAATWVSVCWSPYLSLFVAVNSGGTTACVMTSPDGITWTNQTGIAVTGGWTSVCWSPILNMLIAVGGSATNGAVMYSANGTSWTSGSAANTNAWSSVCYSNNILNLFVGVSSTAATGNSMYSSSLIGGSTYNNTLTIGTQGTSNVTVTGASVVVFPIPYYYGESTIALSINANTPLTDITINDVPNGTYLVQIWMLSLLKTGGATTDFIIITGSVQGTVYSFTATPAVSLVGSASATNTSTGPKFFQFLIKSNSTSGSQNISYQYQSSGGSATALFTAGVLRTMFLHRVA